MTRKQKIVSQSEHHVLSKFGGKIEIWMKKKLPYPSSKVSDLPAWVEKVLKPLRSELQNLEAEPDEIIEARYISTKRGKADVENLLFYNVRKLVASFGKSSRHGLRFSYLDRSRYPDEECPRLLESSECFAHYKSYQLVKKDAPFFRGKCESVASYEFSCSKPEPENVWWSSVNAEWSLNPEWKRKMKKGALKDFALRVDAQYPQEREQCAVSHLKKVFDGIVSAMHVWTNEEWVDEVTNRVKRTQQKVSRKLIRAKLQNNDHAFLGENNKKRWDPADDRCVAGELLLSPNTEDKWHFKVDVLSIE